jgi:hypothetical protein
MDAAMTDHGEMIYQQEGDGSTGIIPCSRSLDWNVRSKDSRPSVDGFKPAAEAASHPCAPVELGGPAGRDRRTSAPAADRTEDTSG